MKTKDVLAAVAAFLIFSPILIQAQTGIEVAVKAELAAVDALVGVAWKHVESQDSGSVNDDHRYPMQSVFKFPIALAILHAVEQGEMALSDKVPIKKEDYFKTWSPIMRKHPDAGVELTIEDLIRYSVAQSDNVACDVLFRLIGGPAEVDEYIHALGIQDMAIRHTEREMHSGWEPQFANWSRPAAMVTLLGKFHRGEVLSGDHTALLRKIMEETITGSKRLKGLLPAGTAVAHKTGTGGRNEKGMTPATNDVGLITLPDGSHVAVAVFVTNAVAEDQVLETTIARVAKVIYDSYATAVK